MPVPTLKNLSARVVRKQLQKTEDVQKLKIPKSLYDVVTCAFLSEELIEFLDRIREIADTPNVEGESAWYYIHETVVMFNFTFRSTEKTSFLCCNYLDENFQNKYMISDKKDPWKYMILSKIKYASSDDLAHKSNAEILRDIEERVFDDYKWQIKYKEKNEKKICRELLEDYVLCGEKDINKLVQKRVSDAEYAQMDLKQKVACAVQQKIQENQQKVNKFQKYIDENMTDLHNFLFKIPPMTKIFTFNEDSYIFEPIDNPNLQVS